MHIIFLFKRPHACFVSMFAVVGFVLMVAIAVACCCRSKDQQPQPRAVRADHDAYAARAIAIQVQVQPSQPQPPPYLASASASAPITGITIAQTEGTGTRTQPTLAQTPPLPVDSELPPPYSASAAHTEASQSHYGHYAVLPNVAVYASPSAPHDGNTLIPRPQLCIECKRPLVVADARFCPYCGSEHLPFALRI